jgi:hypothetical protein
MGSGIEGGVGSGMRTGPGSGCGAGVGSGSGSGTGSGTVAGPGTVSARGDANGITGALIPAIGDADPHNCKNRAGQGQSRAK